jgi:hypothetical protein
VYEANGARLSHRRAQRENRCCRSKYELTAEMMAREYVWLWGLRHGISIRVIAAREGVSIRRIQLGAARARARNSASPDKCALRLPQLVPLFPVGSYTPHSTCAHRAPIQRGSPLCCMVCHCSGMDGHPALQRDPHTEPLPERSPQASPASRRRETRRQRRRRLFGTPSS